MNEKVTKKEEEKEKAMRAILRLLRSPLSIASLRDQQEAVRVAAEFNLTVEELIQYAVEENWRRA